jgi:hypothetical protein
MRNIAWAMCAKDIIDGPVLVDGTSDKFEVWNGLNDNSSESYF